MVRLTKWTKDTKPQHPITAVASRSLREQLQAVWHYAPLAAKRWEEDIKHLHQLRVSTRRRKRPCTSFLICFHNARRGG